VANREFYRPLHNHHRRRPLPCQTFGRFVQSGVPYRLPKNAATLVIVAVVAATLGVLLGNVVTAASKRTSQKELLSARPAVLDVKATVFEKFGLIFSEKAVTKPYRAGYDEALATYLLGSLSDLPLIRAYERNGAFAAEKLAGLRNDSQLIEQQLRETEAIFQVVAVFTNTGDEAATISKVEFAFPMNRGDPLVGTFADQAITLDGNSSKAKVYSIEMRLFPLLAERLKKAAPSLDTKADETAPSSKDEQAQLVAQVAAKIDADPFVNLRGKVQVTVYDQKGREFRSEADFSKILTFLETQIPPEFKNQKDAKEAAKREAKAELSPKSSPAKAEKSRSN